MNRAELSWALSAALAHAGKPPALSFVGIEHRKDWLYVYSTDRYSLGIARIPYPDTPVANGYARNLLTAKEATELERWIRPGYVAEREQNVAYTATDTELHFSDGVDSTAFTAGRDSKLDELLALVSAAISLPLEWDSVALNPAFVSRFTKAIRDGSRFVRLEPKRAKGSGVWLATVGSDFVGLVMNLAYSFTPAADLADWPITAKEQTA